MYKSKKLRKYPQKIHISPRMFIEQNRPRVSSLTISSALGAMAVNNRTTEVRKWERK